MGHPAKAGWLIFYRGYVKSISPQEAAKYFYPIPYILILYLRTKAHRPQNASHFTRSTCSVRMVPVSRFSIFALFFLFLFSRCAQNDRPPRIL
ncbi:MAG: hypothetical protein RL742_206, partial [Bacteroidota bacterium]